MHRARSRFVGWALAIPLGLVLAFLFVLAPLFSDGPSSLADPERIFSFGLTAVLFLAAATMLSWLARGDWWTLGVLGLPGIAIAVWYSTREPVIAGLAGVYVVLVVAAILVGRRLGLRLRRSKDSAA